MFNVIGFIAALDRGAIAKTSNFEVLVTRNNGNADASQMVMRIEAVTKPGRTVSVAGDSIYHYGLKENRASGSKFSDVTISVILSADYRERDFFEEWIDEMIGPYRTSTNLSADMYDIKYFDDYKGGLTITCYDEVGTQTYQMHLLDAFPVSIDDIEYAWNGPDVIAKLKVTFTYQNYIDVSIVEPIS